jgi:hypothetical protein
MTTLQVPHFSAALIFAFFASIVFGITQRSEPREMIKYGAKCFVFFVAGTIAAGWAMSILRH